MNNELTVTTLNKIMKIIDSYDFDVRKNLYDLLVMLVKQYGADGYDSVKILCIIKERLREDLELLNEVK